MTSPSTNDAAILQCLQDEYAMMSALSTLLSGEQAALVGGDIEALKRSSANKAELLSSISIWEKKRVALLSAAAYSNDLAGMRAYLAAHAEASTIQLWEDLLLVSTEAKEKNRSNGLLISRRLSQNQAALGVFQQGGSAGSLYGPNGQSTIKAPSGKGMVAS
ncbi:MULTISPECIES: flagellar protein FlgN [unclassified Undibacterium]|uniref:flagella synthesis protein FlgN n=1 Tax=unclassified Undibacterium TaxID=2630295 RepID=UPI002AC97FF3|nr:MULTISPECIES: flagellar protein FlgN [unclassified Undibacterium]MEB0138791.1 flagellar protein FlgN [Undibacterium sp. CCC2.1]MEB0170733.1 flagellar protein FlgN [Undibacterium sp. CCC1.1]MEB0174622.1 flagellar protein FlgN [Undibacterium sp. CCC3.4]MEB0213819.1 flagellar protein FlgN [Undibacterium sp. 5I2]WPX42546.1 flagellar protein FlgN [Undibacterium sp. CCC3.4]